jgi:hypothetical protein
MARVEASSVSDAIRQATVSPRNDSTSRGSRPRSTPRGTPKRRRGAELSSMRSTSSIALARGRSASPWSPSRRCAGGARGGAALRRAPAAAAPRADPSAVQGDESASPGRLIRPRAEPSTPARAQQTSVPSELLGFSTPSRDYFPKSVCAWLPGRRSRLRLAGTRRRRCSGPTAPRRCCARASTAAARPSSCPRPGAS